MSIEVKLLVAYLAPRTAWSSVDRVIAYFPDSNPLPQDRHALDKSGYPIFLHSNDRSFLFDQMIMDDHRLPLLHEFWKSIYDTVLTDGNSLCHDQPSPPPPLEMISTNSSLSESLQPASSSSAVESWTFDQGYPQDLHQAPFLYDRQVRRYTMVQSIKMFLNDTLAIEFHNFIEPDVSGLVSSTAEQVQSSSSSVRSNLLITADASTMTESVADDENNLKATLDNVHQVPEVITNQHRQQQSSSPPPPSSSSSSSFSSSQPLQPIISTNSTTQEEDLLDQNTSSVSNQPISTTKPAPPYTLQVSSSSPMRQSSKDSTESSPELQFDISYYLQQQDSLIDNKSSNSINDTPIIFMDESKVRLVRMMSTEHDMVVMEEKEKEEEVVVRPPADQQAFSQLHPQHQHAATSTTSLPLKINQVDRPISQDEYVTQSGFMQQDEITSAVSQAQPNTATTTSVASAVAAATLEELEVQEESSTAHAHITSQDGQQVFLASPHDSEFPLFDLTAISCLDEGGIYNNTSPSFSLKRKFDQGEGGKQEIVAGVSLSSIITTAAAAAAPTLLDDHHHHNNGISLDNLSPSNILSMQPFESQDASRYSKEQQRQRHLSLDDDDLFGVGAGSTCLSILPFDSPTRPNNWVIPNLAGGDGGGDWNGVADETNFNAANDSASGGDFGNNNNEDVSMILVDQSMDDQIPETLDNGTNESFLIPSTTRNLVDSQEMEEHDNILFLQASMQMFADSLFANPNAYCESQVAATDFPYHHHQQQQHTAQNELVLVPETQMSEADDGAGHTGGEGDSQEMTEEWQPPTTFTIPQPIPSAETDFMTDSMLLMDQEIVDCSLTPLETIKSQLAAAASSTTTRDSSKLPSSPCVNILCIITSIPSCVQHVQIKKGYFSNQSVAVSNIEVADETLASRVVYINLWRDKADWIDTKFGGLDLGDVIFVTSKQGGEAVGA